MSDLPSENEEKVGEKPSRIDSGKNNSDEHGAPTGPIPKPTVTPVSPVSPTGPRAFKLPPGGGVAAPKVTPVGGEPSRPSGAAPGANPSAAKPVGAQAARPGAASGQAGIAAGQTGTATQLPKVNTQPTTNGPGQPKLGAPASNRLASANPAGMTSSAAIPKLPSSGGANGAPAAPSAVKPGAANVSRTGLTPGVASASKTGMKPGVAPSQTASSAAIPRLPSAGGPLPGAPAGGPVRPGVPTGAKTSSSALPRAGAPNPGATPGAAKPSAPGGGSTLTNKPAAANPAGMASSTNIPRVAGAPQSKAAGALPSGISQTASSASIPKLSGITPPGPSQTGSAANIPKLPSSEAAAAGAQGASSTSVPKMPGPSSTPPLNQAASSASIPKMPSPAKPGQVNQAASSASIPKMPGGPKPPAPGTASAANIPKLPGGAPPGTASSANIPRLPSAGKTAPGAGARPPAGPNPGFAGKPILPSVAAAMAAAAKQAESSASIPKLPDAGTPPKNVEPPTPDDRTNSGVNLPRLNSILNSQTPVKQRRMSKPSAEIPAKETRETEETPEIPQAAGTPEEAPMAVPAPPAFKVAPPQSIDQLASSEFSAFDEAADVANVAAPVVAPEAPKVDDFSLKAPMDLTDEDFGMPAVVEPEVKPLPETPLSDVLASGEFATTEPVEEAATPAVDRNVDEDLSLMAAALNSQALDERPPGKEDDFERPNLPNLLETLSSDSLTPVKSESPPKGAPSFSELNNPAVGVFDGGGIDPYKAKLEELKSKTSESSSKGTLSSPSLDAAVEPAQTGSSDRISQLEIAKEQVAKRLSGALPSSSKKDKSEALRNAGDALQRFVKASETGIPSQYTNQSGASPAVVEADAQAGTTSGASLGAAGAAAQSSPSNPAVPTPPQAAESLAARADSSATAPYVAPPVVPASNPPLAGEDAVQPLTLDPTPANVDPMLLMLLNEVPVDGLVSSARKQFVLKILAWLGVSLPLLGGAAYLLVSKGDALPHEARVAIFAGVVLLVLGSLVVQFLLGSAWGAREFFLKLFSMGNGNAQQSLVRDYLELGDTESAQAILAAKTKERTVGIESLPWMGLMALAHAKAGRLSEGERFARDMVSRAQTKVQSGSKKAEFNKMLWFLHNCLGQVLVLEQRFPEALAAFSKALEVAVHEPAVPVASIVETLCWTGRCYNAQGRCNDALPFIRRAKEVSNSSWGLPRRLAVFVEYVLGDTMRGLPNSAEASEELLLSAVSISEKIATKPLLAETYDSLTRLYVANYDKANAADCYNRAMKCYEERGQSNCLAAVSLRVEYSQVRDKVSPEEVIRNAVAMASSMVAADKTPVVVPKKVGSSRFAGTASRGRVPGLLMSLALLACGAYVFYEAGLRAASMKYWISFGIFVAFVVVRLLAFIPSKAPAPKTGAMRGGDPASFDLLKAIQLSGPRDYLIQLVAVLALAGGALMVNVAPAPSHPVPAGLTAHEYQALVQRYANADMFGDAKEAEKLAVSAGGESSEDAKQAQRFAHALVPKSLPDSAALKSNETAIADSHSDINLSMKNWLALIKQYPEFEAPYVHAAHTYLGAKDSLDASLLLDKVLKMNPNYVPALRELAALKTFEANPGACDAAVDLAIAQLYSSSDWKTGLFDAVEKLSYHPTTPPTTSKEAILVLKEVAEQPAKKEPGKEPVKEPSRHGRRRGHRSAN